MNHYEKRTMYLKEIDELNEVKSKIERKIQSIHYNINELRNELLQQNKHFLGKKAICSHIDNPHPVECICTYISTLEDCSGIRPHFSRNGKKYLIDTYEWLD